MFYVIVLLQDQTIEHGPFTFLPGPQSEKVRKATDYWEKGHSYRLRDEDVYAAVDPKHRIEMTYPKGTVLFIDPSRCMHYGARNGKVPRYQLMFALTSVCRKDFSDGHGPTYRFPLHSDDSQLRRMILDRDWS